MQPSYTEVGTDIVRAAAIVASGRVVAVPTGTAYGLAADALQGYALQRVRNLKQRPAEKSLTVFLAESLWSKYLQLTATEQKVLKHFHNQPLTLLVKPQSSLEHLAQDGRIGLRQIDQPLMQSLADAIQVPLTATSANLSGQDPCFDPASIQKVFPGRIDDSTYDLSLGYILDGGQLSPTQMTTIARIDDRQVTIVRPGAISQTDLETLL